MQVHFPALTVITYPACNNTDKCNKRCFRMQYYKGGEPGEATIRLTRGYDTQGSRCDYQRKQARLSNTFCSFSLSEDDEGRVACFSFS